LLARSPAKAHVRLDQEGDARGAEALAHLLPARPLEDRAEVAHGDVVAVDVVGFLRTAGRREEMRGDLVPEEVEVDPVLGAAALAAAEDPGVEGARRCEVADGKGEVERESAAHPRLSIGTYERLFGPMYTCRGLPIRKSGSWRISRKCAIQPGRRPIANSTVNMFVGIESAW